MSRTESTGAAAGGQGRLARLLATRGGSAAPEAPFVIEHREALIYMLYEAAELEHGIMCQYLFAAFSLKQNEDEGLSETELEAVRRWRRQVSHVATQEMLHLALVHNLLSAIGAGPHLARPNLPAPARHYPAGVQLALLPFGEQALRHFMFLERPEGMALDDAEGLAAVGKAAPLMTRRDIVPHGQDFATVGHLYRSIEAGMRRLARLHGEDWLFVGPRTAQATAEHFGWPELVAVTGLGSACRAIEEIVEQGEGPRGNWRDAHFGQFVNIFDEYQQLRETNPGFDPVRPVVAANVRPSEREVEAPLIDDPLTARVTDLFNVGYEILLQILERFFAHTEETEAQLKTLADASVEIMFRVIRPLGDLITTLPVGAAQPGRTAGPSFELFFETDYLMPHREAAWALLAERLDEAAWLATHLGSGRGAHLAGRLQPVVAALREIAGALAAELPAASAHARPAPAPFLLQPAETGALLGRAGELAASVPEHPVAGPQGDLAGVFRAAHSIVESAASTVDHGLVVSRLVESVLRPLADALRAAESAGASTARAPESSGRTSRPAAAAAPIPVRVWDLARTATELRSRLGGAGSCPAELAEAVAALQDLACRLGSRAEAETRRDELWRLQSGLPAGIDVERNGPYLVTNVSRLADHLGAVERPAPQLALCRCGKSAIKPFCDGSHARAGFRDGKDPNRVPDRLDSYSGEQLTILDNRGSCQHSGFCTGRLPVVFRIGADPFVAPSGGRMDEIIRAVRDCPSGALSYAIDGVEARAQVDRGGTRQPTIEVSKDGPYRITGHIALVGADGAPEPLAAGASTEHYALCRCGHSRNKPFCSGMHWYVGFSDPVLGPEPTLFEWAGGLPALRRMSRLLYEKHIPDDPLLAPVFADMPPDQPDRLADWLAGALGGPVTRGPDGDLREVVGFAGPDFGEPHRARWVVAAGVAADQTALPVDAGFRSALAAGVDWLSRAALAQAQSGSPTRPEPAPRWGWGPGGPPHPGAVPADGQAGPPRPGAVPAQVGRSQGAPVPAGDGRPQGGAISAEAGRSQEAAVPAGAGRPQGGAVPAEASRPQGGAVPAGERANPHEPSPPAPEQPVGFEAHIRPLFRPGDRQSMSFAFDLWSFDDVRVHSAEILRRLGDGSMPCDGGWPAGKIELFRRWVDTGMHP